MNLYWYWPFLRREELALVTAVLRIGDRLVVHTTPRPTDPIASPEAACEIRSTLPGVADRSEGSVAWAASRAVTYGRRAAARRRAIGAGAFDLAHIVYLNPFTDAADLARLGRRVPLVSSVHDVVPHNSRVPAPVERMMLRVQYGHAGTLVVHHESVRRRLLAEFPVDPARVEVVPLPIPLVPWSPRPARDHPATVLFFGTFRRNKGVAVLLEAIEMTRDATDARFVFAGRGSSDVERLVVDAAARDPRLRLELGYVTAARKEAVHAEADLAVLPYTSFASQSAVLQDAYSHRLPLVVSDVGALGVTVCEDGTGWVVAPNDPRALASTLLDALADDAGRAAASAAADAVARRRTPLLVGQRLRELYERVAGTS